MQGAEFEIDHQDAGVRIGTDEVVRKPQGIDRRVAAHEADGRALDAGVEPGGLDDQLVEARRHETGARGHHQMGNSLALAFEAERIERFQRQSRGRALEPRHPGAGLGRRLEAIEAAGVGDLAVVADDGVDEGKAMLNAGALGHALEEAPFLETGE
jgi:hypothetical protein